ncbi:MAG: hypothetical protein AB8G05_06175, partial [Oligoflexales bacterium]
LMENIFWTIEILDTRLGISWNYKWMGNTGVCFVFQLNKLPKISVGARIALCLVLGSTVYTLANIVSSSAKDNVLAAIKKPTSLMMAEKNLTALSSQQQAVSEAISNYDPKKQKNKIVYATAEFNKKGGLEDKIKLARTEVASEQNKFESSESYIRALNQSETHGDARKIAVVWNIVLMFFLGHLIREIP